MTCLLYLRSKNSVGSLNYLRLTRFDTVDKIMQQVHHGLESFMLDYFLCIIKICESCFMRCLYKISIGQLDFGFTMRPSCTNKLTCTDLNTNQYVL